MISKLMHVKDVSKEGTILACFATIGVIDKDGDLTLPGFIGEQNVVMLPAHQWQHVPIGKGKTRESGNEVLCDLKMNLEIPAAKDWYSALKFDLENKPPQQEYSYGFDVLDGGSSPGGEVDGQKAARTLRPRPDGTAGCKVFEVSPVLVGAGEGTRTLDAKGRQFCDEAEEASRVIEGLVARARSLAELRAKDDRGLSAVSRERLKGLMAQLDAVMPVLRDVTKDREAVQAARVELGRFLRKQVGL